MNDSEGTTRLQIQRVLLQRFYVANKIVLSNQRNTRQMHLTKKCLRQIRRISIKNIHTVIYILNNQNHEMQSER